MTPFPHFVPLAPATARQAAAVYALLRVAPRVLAFDRLTAALALIATLYYLLLLWLLLRTGLAARFRDWAERWLPGRAGVQAMIVYALLAASLAVAGLPLSLTRGWWVLRAYGLSNQTAWQWLGEHFESLGINAAVGALLAGALLTLIRRAPSRWPLGFAALLTPVIAFGIFAEPLLVEPLFNRFTPLPPSSPLYAPLHALTRRAGVGDAPIFVVDKSRQTNATNAYVAGFGPSLRIVLWDTTLRRMPAREVVAITGHELGHYVEGHLVIGFALSVAALLLGFPLIRWAALRLLARHGPRWRLRPTLADPACLALLLLCLTVGELLLQPATNAVSRWIEHRADGYSLGVVRDRVGLARSFVDLSSQDLDNPYPPTWEKVWFYDHPPLGERIRYALEGQP